MPNILVSPMEGENCQIVSFGLRLLIRLFKSIFLTTPAAKGLPHSLLTSDSREGVYKDVILHRSIVICSA